MARDVQVSPGGVYDLGYHVVWCAKYRRPVLTDAVNARCEELIRARVDEHGWRIVALEVLPDHVQLFVKTHPADSPSYVANQLNGFTSGVLRQEFAQQRSRLPTLWSRSYLPAIGSDARTFCRYLLAHWQH
jgi:putative transposase